jgi:uncharacterized protein YecE (DUF72 family)
MRIFAGTSGFSYKEWKGTFYPDDIADRGMLAFYSTKLTSVEINNTFYRMPKEETISQWGAQVSGDFRFVLKAPQRITHRERLEHSEESVGRFLDAARVLGDKLGALLFQLPPFFKKDVDKLRAFLPLLPDGVHVAFEFRHPSWYDEETYAALRAKNVAVVGGDADDSEKSPPFVTTANFGYLRLRAPEYRPEELRDWAVRVRAEPWETAFVFLKHEVKGPEYAAGFAGAFASLG